MTIDQRLDILHNVIDEGVMIIADLEKRLSTVLIPFPPLPQADTPRSPEPTSPISLQLLSATEKLHQQQAYLRQINRALNLV